MAVRFVNIKGSALPVPNIIRVYASGTIHPGGVVEFSRVDKRVVPASSSTTQTNVFGLSLDYVEGASDTVIRVVPFAPGQLWEIDCTNTVATSQLMIRHALTNNLTLANSNIDRSIYTGIFVAYQINTIIANTLIGEFIRTPYFDKSTGAAYL